MTVTKKLKNPFRPIRICSKAEIHISVFVLFAAAIALNFWQSLAVTYIIVIIHELAHVFTARHFGIQLDKFEIMPFGVTGRLKTDNISSPDAEMKIALAGPVSNMIMALFALGLAERGPVPQDAAYFFAAVNCCIGLLNIIPAVPLDGGRILRAYLTTRMGYIKAYNITMLVTKLAVIAMFLCGGALLAVSRFNFSVLMIACFITANVISEQRGKSLILMREILYSRQKLKGEGAAAGGVISVMADAPAMNVLKKLSYNKYYIINIVDEDMNIIGTVTETALICALMEHGSRIKARQLACNITSAQII